MTWIERFSGYLLEEGNVSEEEKKAAETALADTAACIAAGMQEESALRVLRYIERKDHTDAEDRALLWGTAGHALDYDCQNHLVDGHDSVPVTAVILALSERYPITGERAVSIYAKAITVDSWLGMMRKNVREGWNGSSHLSILGCTAAACMMMGLGRRQTENALGLSLTNAFGLSASFGYLAKDILIGRTAAAGIFCARMAQAGIDAPVSAVEGAGGYGKFYLGWEGGEQFEDMVSQVRRPLVAPGLSYKLYPVCFSVQTGYQVIRKLRKEHPFCAEDVESIEGVLQYDMEGVRVHPIPEKAYTGRFDLRYCIALEVLGRPVDMDSFKPGAPRDEEAAALCAKIGLRVDYEKKIFDGSGFCGVELTIKLKDGREYTERMDDPKGGNKDPLSEEQLMDKIEKCCDRSAEHGKAARMADILRHFRKMKSTEELAVMLYGKCAAQP